MAQQTGKTGGLCGLTTGYEIQINEVKAICLHAQNRPYRTFRPPQPPALARCSANTETVYQSVQQALHTTVSTRQSRKGEISSWKAFAPSHAGKLAIEAVDRCMRGEGAPSPIYEGEDSFIAWILDGPEATYAVPLPEAGEPKRAILESYTKEHSAEYQSQALIDSPFGRKNHRLGGGRVDLSSYQSSRIMSSVRVRTIRKRWTRTPVETLDHSIMYILAVALQDGEWHHVRSYAPERASREDTIRLWHKISTIEDAVWTERYHDPDPDKRAFGGRLEVKLSTGETITDELAVANAHPAGERPFNRSDYIGKFKTLTEGIVDPAESERFLDLVQDLANLDAGGIQGPMFSSIRLRCRHQKQQQTGFSNVIYAKIRCRETPRLRDALMTGCLLQMPGAHPPIVARIVEEIGFDGIYISGGALSAN